MRLCPVSAFGFDPKLKLLLASNDLLSIIVQLVPSKSIRTASESLFSLLSTIEPLISVQLVPASASTVTFKFPAVAFDSSIWVPFFP